MAFDDNVLRAEVYREFAEARQGLDPESLTSGYSIAAGMRDTEPSLGVEYLLRMGEDFRDHGDYLRRASDGYRARSREHLRTYFQTEKGRAARARDQAKRKVARVLVRAEKAAQKKPARTPPPPPPHGHRAPRVRKTLLPRAVISAAERLEAREEKRREAYRQLCLRAEARAAIQRSGDLIK